MAKSTKQLAKELGLLRKRPLSLSSPRGLRKKQRNDQKFSYLIVIDFESTCWEKDKLIPQEIIEFPAVLLNAETGHIEDEFHYYLQPVERPVLSEFCKQLTGISQKTVDDGIPLSLCLRKFSVWLRKLKENKGIFCVDDKGDPTNDQAEKKMAALVTWSDWDFGVCLLYETRRKQITRPVVFNSWIDLRATYRNFYKRRPEGLNGALKELGIEFEGRQHSGVDDAKNTAMLAWKMMCDGCVMALTKTLKIDRQVEKALIPTKAPNPSVKARSPFVIAEDRCKTGSSTSVKKGNVHRPQLLERNQNVPFESKEIYLNDSLESNKTVLEVKPSSNQQLPDKIPMCDNSAVSVENDLYNQTRGDKNLNISSKIPLHRSRVPVSIKTSKSNALLRSSPRNVKEDSFASQSPPSKSEVSKTNLKNLMMNVKACENSTCFPNSNEERESLSIKTSSPRTPKKLELPNNRSRLINKSLFTNEDTKIEQVFPSKHSRTCQEKASVCAFKMPGVVSAASSSCDADKENHKAAGLHMDARCVSYKDSLSTSRTSISSQPLKSLDNGFSYSVSDSFKTPSISRVPIQKVFPKSSLCRCKTFRSSPAVKSHKETPRNIQTTCDAPSVPSVTRDTSPSIRDPSKRPAVLGSKISWPLKTPVATSTLSRSDAPRTLFKTPTAASNDCRLSMRVTPPLCLCGRRSKRRQVQKCGPNMGRMFFSCSISRPIGNDNGKSGCKFFKWEWPGECLKQ